MEKRNFVTIADLDKDRLLYLLKMAEEFERHPDRELLKGKVVATLFFEPSTRTQLSFQTAANRLGARVIGFSDAKTSSTTKGETLKDTILMVSNYADIIVMRHYIEGAAQYASEVAPVPIVNAGDGAHMHPSQCLLDLAMPDEYKEYCAKNNIRYVEHAEFTEDEIADADILYMTRVQKERFSDLMEYERVKNVYILRNAMLSHVKPNMKIMHPLPRVNEIAYDVDDNPHAYYIQQAKNGLFAREAIYCYCLGISLDDIKKDKTIIG